MEIELILDEKKWKVKFSLTYWITLMIKSYVIYVIMDIVRDAENTPQFTNVCILGGIGLLFLLWNDISVLLNKISIMLLRDNDLLYRVTIGKEKKTFLYSVVLHRFVRNKLDELDKKGDNFTIKVNKL